MSDPGIRHTQKRHVALGVERRPGFRRVLVEFDDEMFAHIRQLAIEERNSFAEQVRILCEWGLEEIREERRDRQ